MRYALMSPEAAASGSVHRTGTLRLGLVYAVSLLFVVLTTLGAHGLRSNVDINAEYAANATPRAWEQFNRMWNLATPEQQDYLCMQWETTDGNAAWNQALADNRISYDGFNADNRDLWNQFLTAECFHLG